MRLAVSRTACTAGNRSPTNKLMIPSTTNNSTSVNPSRRRRQAEDEQEAYRRKSLTAHRRFVALGCSVALTMAHINLEPTNSIQRKRGEYFDLVVNKSMQNEFAHCPLGNLTYDTDLTLANHFVSLAMVGLLTSNVPLPAFSSRLTTIGAKSQQWRRKTWGCG